MMQWRVDGLDSEGVSTLLVLYRDGRDTGLRVSRAVGADDLWLVHDGGSVVDAEPVGCYIDAEHAQRAAIDRAQHPRLWDCGYASWESVHYPGAVR